MTKHEHPDTRTVVDGYAWGYNNKGGLGAAGSARALAPIPAVLPAGTVDVQGGSDFSVALTADGQVYTWGGNQWGQLGDGSTRHRFRPHRVELTGRPHIVAIAAGQDHVVALARHGRVFAWGRNHHGQVGDGTRVDRHRPVVVGVPGSGSIVSIAAGTASSYAISSSGAVYGWGHAAPMGAAAPANGLADSAPGVTNAVRAQRLRLPYGVRVTAVDAGQRHLVVLTGEGQLLAYGRTASGQTATQAVALHQSWGKVTAICAGDNHTVALTDRHLVLAWGANSSGELATRDTTRRDAPVKVRIPKQHGRVVQVLASGASTYARTDTGHVYAWGHGGFGQHGVGSTANTSRPEPVALPDHTALAGLFTARYHCFATVDR